MLGNSPLFELSILYSFSPFTEECSWFLFPQNVGWNASCISIRSSVKGNHYNLLFYEYVRIQWCEETVSSMKVICVCAQLPSHVWLFATPWTVAHQAPLPWNSPARIPECIAISSSRGSSWLRDWTHDLRLLHWQAGSFPLVPTGKPKNDLLIIKCI